VQTATMYVTQKGQLAIQSAGIAGWTNPKIDLCSALPAQPDFHAMIADFTIAAYTGYVQQTFTLTGGYVDQPLLKSFAISNLIKFPGATALGENEAGFVIADSATHDVWAWGVFQVPVNVSLSTDLIAILAQLFDDLSSSVLQLP
jgi:hypothetical protein